MFFEKLGKAWRALLEGVANVIKWFPVVWRDRNYDFHFLVEQLRHKIKLMRDFFAHESVLVDYERIVTDLELILELLDKALELDEQGATEGMQELVQEALVYLAENFVTWWE